ncbi:MAG: tetratricopeptide repeat protein [Alphaproteobacteria bacterium]
MTTASEALKAGWDAAFRNDYKTALKLWRPLAEQGNSDAQISLGYVYLLGREVKQDDAEAYFWYSLAAALKWNPLTSAFADYQWPDPPTHDPITNKPIIVQKPPTNEQEAAMVVETSVKEMGKRLTPEQKMAVDKRVADWLKDHPVPASKP